MRLAPTITLSLWALALGVLAAGCGTTKWSDSPRTATEQLLISDAVDKAVAEIDFGALANKSVYLDTRFIITAIDQNYIISTLRQHMLASGCIMHDKAEDATYIVEVRLGSVGTNRQDLLFGMPSTTVPTVGLLPSGAATIPEIALMKRTNQQGVCKIAVFAYSRMSGRPVWQSGNRQVASRAKDIWVLGAGPFQRGTIYSGTAFAGEHFSMPLVSADSADKQDNDGEGTVLKDEKVFDPEESELAEKSDDAGVSNASYNGPASKGDSRGAPAADGNSAKPSAAPAPAAPDSKPAAASPDAKASADLTPPKPVYTPPPPPPVAVPPTVHPVAGPQGNLTSQPAMQPTANPAATTAGAIQTYNLARDLLDKQKTGTATTSGE